MTFLPKLTFDILLHGLVGVDYILHLSAPLSPEATPSSTRFAMQHEIEREERVAGGLMWRVAAALSDVGVRVALSGNPLGDDSNGRLVERENQTRDWLWSNRVASWETPYWVVLQTPNAPEVVLSRVQSATQHDCEEFGEQSSTRLMTWPRAKLICCSDELPFSSLALAHFAHVERIPLWLVPMGNVSADERTRAAVDELRSLAATVVTSESDGAKEQARDLATQLRVSLRVAENSFSGQIGAE